MLFRNREQTSILCHFFCFFFALFLFVGSLGYAEAMPTPEQAFLWIKEGNERFVAGKRESVKNLLKELEKVQETQAPYAAILSCSDSRVPPELIFDESLGKLFIIR